MGDGFLSDAAVEAIQDSVRTTPIEMDGEGYLTRQVYLPPADPTWPTLKVATLAGVLEYMSAHPDEREQWAEIQIVNESTIRLNGRPTGRHNQRPVYVEANAATVIGKGFTFEQWYSAEEFNIRIQAMFVGTTEREAVLRCSGNIIEEEIRQLEDDGVSQYATGRKGISKKEDIKVPNPVHLAPFRTFREIDQPVSTFIFRARTGPLLALFEADGGLWKQVAMVSIRDYLKKGMAGVEELTLPIVG